MKLDDIKKLTQKKYREQFGYFLLEGEHLVLELQKAAQQNPELQASELYIVGNFENWRSVFKKHVITERQMAQISDTKTPQGIVAVVPISAVAQVQRSTQTTRAIYLHEVQDPGNLGTILRTLAWFGGFRCLLSPNSVDAFNPKVVRASMGAIFHVPIEVDIPLSSLGARFQKIAGMDMHGESIQSPAFSGCDCYVFGNEARGVPLEQLAELKPSLFTIPGSGDIESLNLASAVTVCAYELGR
jgi:RNA methyltransferase, TrmH family